jgi:hypothetical protein
MEEEEEGGGGQMGAPFGRKRAEIRVNSSSSAFVRY